MVDAGLVSVEQKLGRNPLVTILSLSRDHPEYLM